MIQVPLDPPRTAKYTLRIQRLIAQRLGLAIFARGMMKDDSEAKLIEECDTADESFLALITEIQEVRPLKCIAYGLCHDDEDEPSEEKIERLVSELERKLDRNEARDLHRAILTSDPDYTPEREAIWTLADQLPFERALSALNRELASFNTEQAEEAQKEKKQGPRTTKKKARKNS